MEIIGINPKTKLEYKVMIVDSSQIERKLLSRFLMLNSFYVKNEVDDVKKVLSVLDDSNTPIDIIFIDATMLAEGGSEVLQRIKTNFPEIKIVFIISTKKQEEYLIKNKMYNYINRPFIKKPLEEKLIEILLNNPIEINSEKSKKSINLKEVYIPPIPDSINKILFFEADKNTGSHDLENILYPDKSLCADLLRVANSSLYGRSGSVKTLQDAITLLGIKTIKNIAIVQARRHLSGNLMIDPIFKKFLYEFPTLCSLISFDIISLIGKIKEYKEIFIFSSFRKMGMNILALNFQNDYRKVLEDFENSVNDLISLENHEISLNHVQVGCSVMAEWKMPKIFIDIVQNQNFTKNTMNEVQEIDIITKTAEILAKKLLNLKITDDELEIIEEANILYKPKLSFVELFGEDYYDGIKEHPFFDLN